MERIALHVRNISILLYAAREILEKKPDPGRRSQDDMVCDLVEASHARDILADMFLPKSLQPERGAYVMRLDERAERFRSRLKARTREATCSTARR